MRNYIIGIDIGGTYIKSGIVSSKGEIKASLKVPTQSERGVGALVNTIARICDELLEQIGLNKGDIIGIGIGSAGVVNSEKGEVCFSANLSLENVKLAPMVEEATQLPVKIANDANCACLAEWKFGNGKGCRNMLLITLGTGVGGGVIVDGKLMEGNQGAGGELGHILLQKNGRKCSCGRNGCIEAYLSGGALVERTVEALQSDKKSKLWKIIDESKMITPKAIFEASEKDSLAKKVVDAYINDLAEGLVDLTNIFRSEVILIGGGISAQGEKLILPVENFVNQHLFGRGKTPKVEIRQAKLGNDAGFVGAAALFVE